MREFLDQYDRRLNLFSREVSVSELLLPEIKSVLNDMRNIASGERDEDKPSRPSLVGLSAPQIGEFVRIILVDLEADSTKTNFSPNLKIFINPRIVETSEHESLMREGCYSTGSICGAVMRPDEVTILAQDEAGQKFSFTSTNPFQAHIIQHEIDHLNGIRFPSRIRDPKRLHFVRPDDFQNYRENWKTWTKLCPVDEWLKMYNGDKFDANVSSK